MSHRLERELHTHIMLKLTHNFFGPVHITSLVQEKPRTRTWIPGPKKSDHGRTRKTPDRTKECSDRGIRYQIFYGPK